MKIILILFLFTSHCIFSQDGIKPIVDVHLHGYTEKSYRPMPGAPETYEAFKAEMKATMEKFNIVAAVRSGGIYDDEMEKKMIPALEMNNYPKMDTVEFKKMIESGALKVWGELMPQFNGLTLADEGFQPYLAICEREGIPVALHTGGGPPGIWNRYKRYRLALGDPLLIEEVLINYPNLKIYLMHFGGYFYEHTLALMEQYQQVYCDLGAMLFVDGLSEIYAEEFLRKAKKGGFTDRIMYGSDAMYWPYHVEKSIKRLDSYNFLEEEDKRKIFYENAVRFFELDDLKP